MTLQIGWEPKVLEALKRLAPADGDTWVTIEAIAHDAPVGLGAAAINLKAAVRASYADKRLGANEQTEYRATEALTLGDPEGAMWASKQ